MTNRANRKFLKLEKHKKLTPEVKAMLKNRKNQLAKKCEEEIRFIDKLLAKPTLKNGEE